MSEILFIIRMISNKFEGEITTLKIKSFKKKVLAGSLAAAMTLSSLMALNVFTLVSANGTTCNPVTVVTTPPVPVVTVADPFVHPGNSGNAIANNPGNALNVLSLNASQQNKFSKWMSQIAALLATTPNGNPASLSAADLAKFNKLMGQINGLLGINYSAADIAAAAAGYAAPPAAAGNAKNKAGNNKDTITASDSTIKVGDVFDVMKGVSAKNGAGKDITNQITSSGSINTSVPGSYKITYTIPGTNVSKTVTVNVLPNVAAGPAKCTPGVAGSP